MSFIYESVFFSLYEMLIDRQEALDDPRLIKIIYEEIALARSGFIDIYNCFVSFCLDKTLSWWISHLMLSS